ncbi:F0F1 ATP synthase subunit B [Fulvimarina sp. 2208YS6-2-32]|uniref:ATP synthase subunit b n=1 Tax=Fulvimarina uroteuthidis TaxID=3098149 RepID=A0ABU5HXQ9_9HYPH|nr:F0F1 ATP synthase subunit B [Fulvimarina sp. 2208YS6-2-32]MDY8107925.1 F0F1 ATP synthase subunit B [Fulvimarina sp. 2208YS6-2-32]
MFVTAANAQTPDAGGNTPPDGSGEDAVLHGETGAGAGHDAGFPPMNPEFFPSQILWLAITFGLFYWILKNVLVPRIGGILENRRDRIAIDVEAAERAKQEADEAHAAYEQELAEARERAHSIGQDARNDAREEGDVQRRKLEAELDARLDEARERIAAAKSGAMNGMDELATDVAETILRDVIKLDVTRDEVSSAVAATRS